jgi:uncharacterized secreted protein with C-terminal beta-propeller domain
LLLIGGCGSNGLPSNPGVQKHPALESFGSCGALQSYIQDTAITQMMSDLEWLKTDYGYGYGVASGGTMTLGAAAAPSTNGGAAPASPAPKAYTTTNDQVAGVDEPDLLKNDGTRIFTLSGNTLYASQSWPASALALKGAVAIEGWPRNMFLNGNRVMVFSEVWVPAPLEQTQDMCPMMLAGVSASGGAAGGLAPSGGAAIAGGAYPVCGSNSTKVTTVDVSNLAAPKVVDELYLPGSFDDGRMVGTSVRMVLRQEFNWPQGLSWYPQNAPDPTTDRVGWIAAVNAMEQANANLIRKTPLSSWLPVGKHKQADGTLSDVSYRCSDFSKVNAPTQLGATDVVTLDIENPDPGATLSRVAILAEPGVLYSSATALYVTTPHWWWSPADGNVNTTYVHKFDISQAGSTVYLASGDVPGYVPNQYAMDELNDNLRMATNVGTLTGVTPSNPWGTWSTSSQISVLAQKGAALSIIGEVGNVSPNQSLAAVRFAGNQGYFSTGVNVDPFLTFDLSDPQHPKQVGTLEIPGVSSYLQPMDATHLLAIGTVQQGPPNYGEQLQLSLFDVSDLANPKRTSNVTVGTGYSWSQALWDPKAFNYFPAEGLLAIPFADYQSGLSGNTYWSAFISDLRVFKVDLTAGITPVGALGMNDVFQADVTYNWVYWWQPEILRSVMADHYVYAIADSGLRVADVASLGTALATVYYPVTTPVY